MSNKKKITNPEKELAREISYCEAEYRIWHDIYENGCYDPTWEDGGNLFFVRNHISYHKQEIKRICTENNLSLPEIYYREYPPEVPFDYMARPNEIRENSRKTLNILKNHADYIYLQNKSGMFDKELNRHINVVLGYVSNLEYYISKNNLVGMRRYEKPNFCLDAFNNCIKAINEYVPCLEKNIKSIQLSLI